MMISKKGRYYVLLVDVSPEHKSHKQAHKAATFLKECGINKAGATD